MTPSFGVLSPAQAQSIGAWIGQLQQPGFNWTVESWAKSLAGRGLYGELAAQPRAAILFVDLGEQLEIIALATHPVAHRQGLMRSLGEDFFAHFKGLKREVWLEVHQDNLPARRLYEKWGFMQVGERPNYYGPQQTAILMTKALPT